MDQKQLKQVKKYRILKVLFYFLGFPLFAFVTFLASTKYLDADPFKGQHLWEFPILETQVFNYFQEWISAPALYAVWIVLAVWLFVSIVHFIMTKVLKNHRARTLVVVVVMLVALLGTMFIIDFNCEKKISAMIDAVNNGEYADGVTVDDYKTQLSYYRTLTSEKTEKNMSLKLKNDVDFYKDVYAVGMFGYDKTGVAGNMGNNIAYYDDLIDDDGNRGVDISFVKNSSTNQWDLSLTADGETGNDHVAVRLAPNAKGQLEINGKTYSHYFFVKKTPVTHDAEGIYVWYLIDMYPNHTVVEKKGAITALKPAVTDGVYGEGIYNANGLFSDGWIMSLENVLEILEDYYSAEPIVNDIIAKHGSDLMYESFDEWHSAVIAEAELRREQYYTGVLADENGETCSPFMQELYKSEMTIAPNKFSLTRGRLDALLAEVGALLGDNGLFDLLLKSDSGMIAELLGGILDDLETGMDLGALLGLPSDSPVYEIIGSIFGKPCTGLVLVLKYTESDKGHFYLALKNSVSDPDSAAIMDLDFSNEVLGLEDDERFLYKDALGNTAINTDYAFDLDHVSKLLSNALTFLLNDFTLFDTDSDGVNDQTLKDKVDELLGGTLGTILGLVGGLINIDASSSDALYTSLATLLDGLVGNSGAVYYNEATGQWKFDIVDLLCGLLKDLYYYQSPAIKNVYDFYVDPEAEDYVQAAQKAFADYDRAYFTGAVYGPTIGSTIIGENLGAANDMNAKHKYTADFGLQDLASVQQLKLNLSYQPVFFPLYTARDMILVFSGLVIFFYFLSFVCAEKEVEYATGTLLVKDKKKKSKKNAEDNKASEETPAEAEENTTAPEEEKEISLESADEPAGDTPQEETISLDSIDSEKEVG